MLRSDAVSASQFALTCPGKSTLFGSLLPAFLSLVMAACAAAAPQGEVPLVPMEDFFRNPEMTYFQLSPDGEYISFLAPWENRLNVHVQKTGSDDATRVTSVSDRDIIWYFWCGDDRIVYLQDTGGDENYRLYAVSPDGSNPQDLTPFEGVKVEPVDELDKIDDEMLISMNKRNPQVFDVYRINVDTGEFDMIAENPGDVVRWMTDHDGKLRVAVATDGANVDLRYRETESDPFETIITLHFRDSIEPLLFTYDNRNLYVSSNIARDKQAIYTYDPRTGGFLELIYEHPQVDVTSLVPSEAKQDLAGIFYYTDFGSYEFFDVEYRQMYESLKKRLKGYEVRFADASRDETKMLIRTFTDKSRGAYYFYDTETDRLKKLVDISPWLTEKHMADVKPVKYTSRDGLTIHGYLTLPRGVKPHGLPTVMYIHGGPWVRDYWGFDPTAQFLANRGYAVLQINYRGSSGYGKAFWTSSFKQWGKAMQDDISDGVKWLMKQGIADPDRVCIYGGSYGGYATLAGLAFTPELYACGIDYVGVSNLFTFFEAFPPYWELMKGMWCEMVGDPVEDEELLREISPLFHVDRMRAPLLVAQGANDPRVKQAESDRIVEALTERGIEVAYIVKENEGHGFVNEENRFDFYRAMEEFLAKHLGGRTETSRG